MTNKINAFKQFFIIPLLCLIAFNGFSTATEETHDAHNPTTEHSTEVHVADADSHEVAADGHEAEGHGHEEEAFDAGKMIMEHVADNHQWHFFGHVSMPLPVILKTANGLEVFSSGHFGHGGHGVYQGKQLYGLKDGSIVVLNETSHEVDDEATAAIMDFSITKNVMAMLISMLIMLYIFISAAKGSKKNQGKAPSGIQSFVEPLIVFVRDDIARPSIGEKRYERFMPFLLSVFFFIWLNNLMGLVPFFPGGVNVTGSISIALVLAVFTLIITFKVANKHYWEHVFAMPGVPKAVLLILTPIEILGLFLRPFVLMIRLFANITAGHIIALAFFSLIFIFGEMNAGLGLGVSVLSLVFTVFMGALELLVAFLQAYVFTLLSAIYFGAAVDEGHAVHNHVDDYLPETH